MELEPGQMVLGRFLVEQMVGQGAMGRVYLARHQMLGLPVALKILSSTQDDEARRRFEREAQMMARVRHPNVVAIMDYGVLDDGSPVIVMELLQGDPLDHRLERHGAFNWKDSAGFVLGILTGLDALHQASVLHRDLKPSNVIVTPGNPPSVKLIDFGIARPSDQTGAQLTRDGCLVGTPAYMAPEQLLGYPVTQQTDLYAVGIIFFELITGRLPFPGDYFDGMVKRLKEPPPAVQPAETMPPVPGFVASVIHSLLAGEVGQRPANARIVANWVAHSLGLSMPFLTEPVVAPPGYRLRPREASTESRGSPVRGGPHQGLHGTGQMPAEGTRMGVVSSDSHPDGASMETDPAGVVANRHSASAVLTSLDVAPAPVAKGYRYLLAANLAPSVAAREEERRWLASLASATGRSFLLGTHFWLAVQHQSVTREQAERSALDLVEQIGKRYGETCCTAWSLADGSFRLNAASIIGSAPLPADLRELIEKVT